VAELDARQRAAVDAGPVDVFVAAGAGSGKTRVLSARFVSAVLGIPPYERTEIDRLLAVTFTEKAAGELAERVRGALIAGGAPASARAVGDAWISTIHGMCSRLLRRHALDAGIDPHFAVLSDVEASALEASALEDVLRASLDSEEFARLLDAYGLDAIAGAARSVRSSMHALGLRVNELKTLPAAEARHEVAQAARELTHMAEEFGPLRKTKTVENNQAAVNVLAAFLHACPLEPGEALIEALEAVDACRPRRLASVEGHDELVAACKDQVERVRRAVSQLLVGGLEQAFIGFAVSFEARYEQLKQQRATLDFEDLQLKTAALLEGNPGLAARYRSHFAMIMLDECQDTNALQLRIIEQLARENLCTVGDENQSIYSFRHADVEVFRARESCVTCKQALDVNYRTAPPLLAAINGLFSHPALLGERFMQLRPPEGAERPSPEERPRLEVRFIDQTAARGEDPHAVDAAHIAGRVEELLAEGAVPGEIAVLMRALSSGRAAKVEAALHERGIPVFIASGGSFFEQAEVVEARALLETIANVWDDAALAVVLAGSPTRLPADALITLRAHADSLATLGGRRPRDVHLWEAATDAGLQLAEEHAAALARTVATIETARGLRGTRPLADTVLDPLLDLDLDLVLFASGRGGARAWSNLLKLARIAEEYESATTGDLGGFLDYLELRELHATSEQEATLDGESDAVRVMSIHAAKGLEFPHVIVSALTGSPDPGPIALGRYQGAPTLGMKYACSGGSLATIASRRVHEVIGAAAEAEAVRLLYVACTRAERSLTVIGRTNPAKEAGSTLVDLLRAALGFGDAEAIRPGTVTVGAGLALVDLIDATLPEATPEHGGDAGERTKPGVVPGAARLSGHLAKAEPPCGGRRVSFVLPKVSYTGLATYQRCPYRYYLTSVIRLPAPPAARGGEALAFGTAVHAVLERLVSVTDDPGPWIDQVARSSGLDEAGRSRLRKAVQAYLQTDVARDVFASEQVLHEAPISVPVGTTVLVGAIDVLARNEGDALIVDYKTGTGELGESEAEDRYRLQGECYALAAFRTGAERVRVIFAELERDRRITYRYGPEDAPVVEAQVAGIVSNMAEGTFAPRSAYDPELCETCPGLGGMCPISRPTRGGAA